MTRDEAKLRQELRAAQRRVQELEIKTQELHAKLIEDMSMYENFTRDAETPIGRANCSGVSSGFALAASRVRTIVMGEKV